MRCPPYQSVFCSSCYSRQDELCAVLALFQLLDKRLVRHLDLFLLHACLGVVLFSQCSRSDSFTLSHINDVNDSYVDEIEILVTPPVQQSSSEQK